MTVVGNATSTPFSSIENDPRDGDNLRDMSNKEGHGKLANYLESMCFVSAVKADKDDKIGLIVKKSKTWDAIYVSQIKPDSKFSATKLEVGMVILTINGNACPNSVKDIQEVIRECEGSLTLVAAKTVPTIRLEDEDNDNDSNELSDQESPRRASIDFTGSVKVSPRTNESINTQGDHIKTQQRNARRQFHLSHMGAATPGAHHVDQSISSNTEARRSETFAKRRSQDGSQRSSRSTSPVPPAQQARFDRDAKRRSQPTARSSLPGAQTVRGIGSSSPATSTSDMSGISPRPSHSSRASSLPGAQTVRGIGASSPATSMSDMSGISPRPPRSSRAGSVSPVPFSSNMSSGRSTQHHGSSRSGASVASTSSYTSAYEQAHYAADDSQTFMTESDYGGDAPSHRVFSEDEGFEQDSGLVIAAELAVDTVELDQTAIANQIRQQLMMETQQADVVLVEHGANGSSAQSDAMRRQNLQNVKPRNVRERIFGDSAGGSRDIGSSPEDFIRKRDHLPWTVKQNFTDEWVASIQTNQKLWEKSRNDQESLEQVRAKHKFSFRTEKEAYEAGQAMATPMMQSINENPICYICTSKFAVLNRPQHCKNCGVVVCSKCVCHWASSRLPDTYQKVKGANCVCLACDWSSKHFQGALLKGDYEKAIKLYEGGNINLRNPYAPLKKTNSEVCYAIHLAILGGNVSLLHWLLTERHCPLRVKSKKKSNPTFVLTSKGRSPLRMALHQKNFDMLQYLVAEQKVSLFEEDWKADYHLVLTHLTNTLIHATPSLPKASPGTEKQPESEDNVTDVGPRMLEL